MPSKARKALDKNLEDIKRLLELHAAAGGTRRGRRYGLEVLNKSAVVLITSYWEAYCEDIAEEGLDCLVEHAKNADALPKDIKKIIVRKIRADQNELAMWSISDDKWRAVLKNHMKELKDARNRRLNTPKWKNIDSLFEEAIGLVSVSSKWNWARKLTPEKARAKLDGFVELRGEIAHRGKAKISVSKHQVEDYRDFIIRAAARTGGAVNSHVFKACGKRLWT